MQVLVRLLLVLKRQMKFHFNRATKCRTKTGTSSKALKKIQQAGIQVSGGFIVGFDSDTPSVFQRQIDFIQQSGIVSAMVGLLNAPKNTKLYHQMEAENNYYAHQRSHHTICFGSLYF